jgi:L-ascorbate metabolism protein UlaG (beta-lactamase superfamily)
MDIHQTLFWIGHASFYIKTERGTIFVDPFNISAKITEKADLVLITHAHVDHWSKEDIKKIIKPEAEIICPQGCINEGDFKNIRVVKPGFADSFRGMGLSTIPAYNTKPERLMMHPKTNEWVGWIVDVNGFKIYHAGDTDFINEMKGLKGIGASLLPMGGHYVMDVDEAVEAAKAIGANYAIPMHYKMLLGKENADAAEQKFKKELSNALIMNEVQEAAYEFKK